jgi:predicted RNA methylase
LADIFEEHSGYLLDSVRGKRMAQAIARTVRPGDVVADVGCGSGILGLMCLEAGASKVWAIDSTPVLEMARETFERAGYADRVQCVHGLSQQVNLPERVDVLICDHVGYFGFDYQIVDFFTDARRRFLKPGAAILPRRIKLELSVVAAPDAIKPVTQWTSEKMPPAYHWVQDKLARHRKYSTKYRAEQVLAAPAELGVLDLMQDHGEFFSWDAELVVDKPGQVNGLGGWFHCELADGVWMTNSPLAADAINRPQVFLPLEQSVDVTEGERIRVHIMARPLDMMIAWNVEFLSSGRRFSQSTWQGMLMSPQDLGKKSPVHVPTLTDRGRARWVVLGYCDGQRSMGEIERLVLANHPDLFPTREEIVRFVFQALSGDAN